MRYTETEIMQAMIDGTTSGAILYFGLASDTPEEYWEDEQDDAFAVVYADAVADWYEGSEDEYQADLLECSGISAGLAVKGEVLRGMRRAKAAGTKSVWYGPVEHAEPIDIDEAIRDIEQMDPDEMGEGTWGEWPTVDQKIWDFVSGVCPLCGDEGFLQIVDTFDEDDTKTVTMYCMECERSFEAVAINPL